MNADISAILSQYIPQPIVIRFATIFGYSDYYHIIRRYRNSGYYRLLLNRWVWIYDNKPIKIYGEMIIQCINYSSYFFHRLSAGIYGLPFAS
jgi:hypothetical protein